MDPSSWFDDLPVIGRLDAQRAAEKLREIDEEELADSLDRVSLSAAPQPTFGLHRWWQGREPAWQHAAHSFGYIGPSASRQEFFPLRHVSEVEADERLKNSRIKVTLDGLRVADYPGRGEHRILFDFYGQNQLASGDVEDLHFNATYRVREGERAAVLGFPIFVGLNVGTQGVSFKCFTVNVKNTGDEAFLSMMDSDLFKRGLKLVTTAQPAIAPLAGLAAALTRTIASRHRNVPVQDFFLGLDFSNVPTRARLAIGSYVAVQIPEALRVVWRWDDWVYQPTSGQVVRRSDSEQLIPYNYVVLGVSRFEE